MTFWETLEIDYGSDLKTIKKAYARLLKVNNPEDNPGGYQRIRQAYDLAVKDEKRRRNSNTQENSRFSYREEKIEIEKEKEVKIKQYRKPEYLYNYGEIGEEKEKIINPYINIKLEEELNNSKWEINKFLARLDEIYNDIHLRVNMENWMELMNMPTVWNIESFSVIEGEVFNFIVEYKYLPPEVWDLIETNYCWSKNEIDLCNKHEEGKVADIIKIIKNPYKPNYNFIINIDEKHLEQYLYLREEAVENFTRKITRKQ